MCTSEYIVVLYTYVLQRGQISDGLYVASSLCYSEMRNCDWFVLCWAKVGVFALVMCWSQVLLFILVGLFSLHSVI